ncbi:MAG: T9SS type A sorting domain-containing protein [Ignavibacterium sp.]|nr:T9SS type A sorting domain-containing protein [Ignavibacterium sp.]
MKNIIFILISLFLFMCFSSVLAQTYSIEEAQWTNIVDNDNDSYSRTRTLVLTITASQNTSNLTMRIWKKPNGGSNSVYIDVPITVLNGTVAYSFDGFGGTYGQLTNNAYDFSAFLRNSSGNTLASITEVEDADMGNERFETATQDVLTIDNVTWTNLADQDGDGYTRSRTMNVTVTAGNSATVNMELRAWPDGTSEALYANVSTNLTSGQHTYIFNVGANSSIGSELPHNTYDFRTLVRESINGTIYALRGPNDDADLNNENFETATEDNTSILEVTPSNQNVSYNAGSTTFTVTSNTTWTVSDNASWLTISPTNGNNNGTLTATYTENATTIQRTATITVTGSSITRQVTVIQAGQISVPTNGLLAYYPFNNNTNDASGNGFNGIVMGGATFVSDVNGNQNCALSFDGLDDVVEVSNFIWPTTDTYTICAFLKLTDLLEERGILSIADYYPRFEISNLSHIYGWPYLIYWWSGGNTSFPLRYASVGFDQWVHLTVINANGNLKGYVNGVKYNESNYNSPQFVNGVLKLGLSGPNYMKGVLDEIRIYDRALTDSEIQAIYLYGSTPGISTPTIVTSVSSLPDFGNVNVGQNSTPQIYIVSGNNLTSNITITAPDGFQVSSNGISWSSSLTLTQSGGSVPNTTIYVQFSPTLAQVYSSNITHVSSGATTQNIAVSGTGVSGCSPNWTPVGNQQYTMNVIGQIIFPDGLSTNTNDAIGAFVGTECRGIAYVTSDGGKLYLSISSNSASGETITFKAWRSSSCEELPVLETITFQDNQIIGTYNQPFQFHAGLRTLNLTFNPQYTWFSINVNPSSLNLNSLFNSPPVNSRIIGQTNFAVWNGTSWVGNLTEIDPKKAYKIYVEQPYTISINGLAIDPLTNPISLGSGWTWTGYLPQSGLPINTALQNVSPAWSNAELVKSQTQFSIYSGGNWVGSLSNLEPGKGYMMQVTSNKILTFPANTLKNVIIQPENSITKQSITPPNWIPVPNMQYTMNVIAKLTKCSPDSFSTSAEDIVGAFVVVNQDTQCRGVQSPDNTGMIYLSIGSNYASGETVFFKSYIHEYDLILPQDTLHFIDNRLIGFPDPYIFNGCIVPVELVSFSANQSNQKISLQWITATETNNMGFEIEKSNDKNNWLKIGFVEGKGTTTEKQNYSFIDQNISNGVIHYRLKQIDYDGTFEYSPVISVETAAPKDYYLLQNYPNPFNPSTTIKYSLKDDGKVSLKIFNSLGEEVRTLVNEIKPAGNYEVEFNASELPSGIYIYSIQAGEFISSKKMILLK